MLRRLAFWWLACTLVLAQTLGAMHGVSHARVGGPGKDGASVARTVAPQAVAWPGGLFKGHEDAGGCRLFDQLSHGDLLLAAPVLALQLVAAVLPVACPRLETPGKPEPPFLARGPPFPG